VAAALACAWRIAVAAPDAVSADGRWTLVGDGGQLLLQGPAPGDVRRYAARSLDGREAGRVRQALHLAARQSFVVAFEGLRELWEISLDPRAEPIFDGFVHDHKMGEGVAVPGFLGVRRTRLPETLTALAPDRSGAFLLGRGADVQGRAVLHLVQLDVRLVIARFVVDGDPALDRARADRHEGRDLLWVPDLQDGPVWRFDVRAASVSRP
jgi:hypothetical protein